MDRQTLVTATNACLYFVASALAQTRPDALRRDAKAARQALEALERRKPKARA